MVHVCEMKKRYQSQNETGIQLGLRAYQKFYEISQGSGKPKSFDDFAKSPYYRAFAKFGQYCVSIRAVNVPRFTEWLLKNNKKIDYWCKDSVYDEFLMEYVRIENSLDALHRAIEQSIRWGYETNNPPHDYLRFGNVNTICYAITSGKITGWALYNSRAGRELISGMLPEQLSMIWDWIDTDFWQKKFKDYPEETRYVKEILQEAGW